MHQRPRLVHVDEGEGDAELHRGERQPALDDGIGLVPGGDLRPARPVIAGGLQLVDQPRQHIGILDPHAIGRHIRPRAVKIGLAHIEGIKARGVGDSVHGALDGQHALRPAKAPEGGVGDCVGEEPAAHHMGGGQVIGVGGVEHGPIHHARRQIDGATAARIERHVITRDAPGLVEAHRPVRAEIVALAGDDEIIVPVEPELAGLAGHMGGKRSEGAGLGGLGFLAAKGAAHAPGLHGDEGVGHGQHHRHHALQQGGVLRRGMDQHFASFARHGEGGLAFEIEMLLPANAQHARELVGRLRDGLRGVANPEIVIGQDLRIRRQRILDG